MTAASGCTSGTAALVGAGGGDEARAELGELGGGGLALGALVLQ